MEDNRNLKRVVRKPIENKTTGNVESFYRVLTVVLFVMVLIIFFRGFGVKKTTRNESLLIQEKIESMFNDFNTKFEANRQIDKNEILSAFALYSRLDAESLKEMEIYHKEQQQKYENIAKQYNEGLNHLVKEIKSPKDTLK